jgi:hypothetical protein
MRTDVVKFVSVVFLLAGIATASAQSTWNYFISDAGGGNSLLTWNVTGSVGMSPGAVLVKQESHIVISVDAPRIFADSFAANGAFQSIPTPDGSYFQLDSTSVYTAISLFEANNVAGSGSDSFGLASSMLFPHQGDPGNAFLYNPATQSVLIPIDFSNFNPGTYQSQDSQFSTPVTVNLTVGPVPEPSSLTWLAAMGVCGLLARGRRSARDRP